jgi:hypothetical protein
MRFLILALTIISFRSFAQTQDSTILAEDSIELHSVRKAVILSTFIPGSGQIYNHIAMPKGNKKAFWKVPLIYGGLGTASYFLISNQNMQKELKSEYQNRQDIGYLPTKWINYDDAGILTLYNDYLKLRDLSILAFGAIYLFQVVDAGVEAHFVSFDVSEDLSLSIQPMLVGFNAPGFSMKLNFR